MTRATWGPPPAAERLAEWPIHRAVRDFPETLAPLRALGLDPAARGAEPLRSAAGEGLTETLESLAAALAWRRRP